MDDRFDRRGGESGSDGGGDGDDGMTRGFPLLLPAMPVVDSLPSIDVSLWTMLVTLGAVTPGSSLTMQSGRTGDGVVVESSTFPAELSSVLLLLFISVEFLPHEAEILIF